MAINYEKAQRKLGTVIRERRKALGYSQEAFAAECGLHRTYMGALERGERNVSLANILKVARALKTLPSELLKSARL